MAKVWEKWRKTIAIFLAILITFFSQESQAATHWIVTENGRIEQQTNSLFDLQKPFDLVSFIHQEQKLNKVNLLRKELKKEQDILDEVTRQEKIDLTETFFKTEPSCMIVNKRWYEMDVSLNYLIPFSSKGINVGHHIDLESPVKEHSLRTPLCLQNIPFSLHNYDHLEGVASRHSLPGIAEQGLLSTMKYVKNVDDWGDRIARALSKNSTSWVLQNMASLYWRIKGNTVQSINCLREAFYYSPSEHRDIALFSLALIMYRSNYSVDAATLLHASLEITRDIGLHKYVLAHVYASLQLFEMTELCLKYVTLVQPTFYPASTGLQVATCEKRFLEALKEQYSSLEKVLSKVNKHEEKRKTLQKLHHMDSIKEEFPYDVFKRQLERLIREPVRRAGELLLSLNQENVDSSEQESMDITAFQKNVVSSFGNKNIDNNEAFSVNIRVNEDGTNPQRQVFCQKAQENGDSTTVPCDLYNVQLRDDGMSAMIQLPKKTQEIEKEKNPNDRYGIDNGGKEMVVHESSSIENKKKDDKGNVELETKQNKSYKNENIGETAGVEQKQMDGHKDKILNSKNSKSDTKKDEMTNRQHEEDDNSNIDVGEDNGGNVGRQNENHKRVDSKSMKKIASVKKKSNRDDMETAQTPNKKQERETAQRLGKEQQNLDSKSLTVEKRTSQQNEHAQETPARVRSIPSVPHASKISETREKVFVSDVPRSSKKEESIRNTDEDSVTDDQDSFKRSVVDYVGMNTGQQQTYCENPSGSRDKKQKDDTNARGCQDQTNDAPQKDENNSNKYQQSLSKENPENTAKQRQEGQEDTGTIVNKNAQTPQISQTSKPSQNGIKKQNQKSPTTKNSSGNEEILLGFKEFHEVLKKSKSRSSENEFDHRNCQYGDNPRDMLSYKNNVFSAVVSVTSRGFDVKKYIDFNEDISGLPKLPRCTAKINPGPKSLDHIKGILQVGKVGLKPETSLKLALLSHAHELGKKIDIDEMGTRIYKGLKKAPESYVLLNLASLYWRISGDVHEAVRCLRLAVQHSPTGSAQDIPLISLSSIVFRAGFLDDAVTLGRAALKVSPNAVLGHFVLANALAAQDVITEATQHYLIVLQLESGFTPVIERLKIIQCALWNQQQELEKEAEELRKLLAET